MKQIIELTGNEVEQAIKEYLKRKGVAITNTNAPKVRYESNILVDDIRITDFIMEVW